MEKGAEGKGNLWLPGKIYEFSEMKIPDKSLPKDIEMLKLYLKTMVFIFMYYVCNIVELIVTLKSVYVLKQ